MNNLNLLSKPCHETFSSLKNPVFMLVFTVFGIIPTRQANPDFNCFCLGDLTRRGSVWFPLSSTHGVYGLLLSKSYQRRYHRSGLLELFTVAWTINRYALPVWYMLFIVVTITWNWPDFNVFIIGNVVKTASLSNKGSAAFLHCSVK